MLKVRRRQLPNLTAFERGNFDGRHHRPIDPQDLRRRRGQCELTEGSRRPLDQAVRPEFDADEGGIDPQTDSQRMEHRFFIRLWSRCTRNLEIPHHRSLLLSAERLNTLRILILFRAVLSAGEGIVPDCGLAEVCDAISRLVRLSEN